jgi:hypothetical protein
MPRTKSPIGAKLKLTVSSRAVAEQARMDAKQPLKKIFHASFPSLDTLVMHSLVVI